MFLSNKLVISRFFSIGLPASIKRCSKSSSACPYNHIHRQSLDVLCWWRLIRWQRTDSVDVLAQIIVRMESRTGMSEDCSKTVSKGIILPSPLGNRMIDPALLRHAFLYCKPNQEPDRLSAVRKLILKSQNKRYSPKQANSSPADIETRLHGARCDRSTIIKMSYELG
jgi:hypothetical protein